LDRLSEATVDEARAGSFNVKKGTKTEIGKINLDPPPDKVNSSSDESSDGRHLNARSISRSSFGIAVVGETEQMTLVETVQQEATGPVILVVTTATDEAVDGETKATGNTVNDPNIEGAGRPS